MLIPYKINQIKTQQFALFPEKFVNGNGVAVKAEYEFKVHTDLCTVLCVSKFSYSQDDNLLLTTQIDCTFGVSQDGFQELHQSRTIPAGFLQYLATISTGTARGIIHTKTEGTVLNSVVLPPINLLEIIKDDLHF